MPTDIDYTHYNQLLQQLDKHLQAYRKAKDQSYQKKEQEKHYEACIKELGDLVEQIRSKQPKFETKIALQKSPKFPSHVITSRLVIEENELHANFEKKDPHYLHLQEIPLKQALYTTNPALFSYVKHFLLRVLQLSPLNKLELTLIDPKTLGITFNFLRPILDNDFIYKQRILTYTNEIEEALRLLADYMENLLQRQLCGVASWRDYNAKHPKQLPLRVLVIHGLNLQFFNDNSFLYLSRLVRFGSLAGINIFIWLEELKDKESSKVPEKWIDFTTLLKECAQTIGNFDLNPTDLKLKFALEPDPDSKQLNVFLEEINHAYKNTSTIKAVLEELLNQEEFLKKSAAEGVSVPLAWDCKENEIRFEVGFAGSEPHTLIGGRSGSGKSNLLNVLIATLCFYYPPEELSLYLLDYKDGVEFNLYTNPPLPQACLIAVNSSVSYGVNVLQHILEEKERRAKLFKEVDATDYITYRQAGKTLPRIILVIDEFQTLFNGKEKDMVEAYLGDIIRKGRSFGIHLVLSTQTLSGVKMDSKGQLLGQIGNRLVLAMSAEDSKIFLGDRHKLPFKGKPYGFFNFFAGQAESIEGKIPLAKRESIKKILQDLGQKYPKTKTKIFDGYILPSIKESRLGGEGLRLVLGKIENFKRDDFVVEFRPQKGQNLLLCGNNFKKQQALITCLKENAKACGYTCIENQVPSLTGLEKTLVILDNFQKLKKWHPPQSYSTDKDTSSSFKDLENLVERGCKSNIHIILIGNLKTADPTFKNFFDTYFYLRVGFNLRSSAAASLFQIDIPTTQAIQGANAVFMSTEEGQLVSFTFFKELA
ncbi:FtsK/SpoIIIE domain-containing protein [Helicobacter suis]|uniref:FtsK/SpoIIIE domain-containing protein n=1 Tax=Helicobacter suis TaxID=104628 RepID=UPI0013D45153|nr:FtsK/SpoIIIE domain-containing protein [Helicobacter suis]